MCIFLMVHDVENLFICILAFSMSSLEKGLFKSLAHCLIKVFAFCIKLQEFLTYFWKSIFYQTHVLEISFPISLVAISLCWCLCFCTEAFKFDVPLVYFCFHCLRFWCPKQEIIAKTNVMKLFPICSSGSCIVSSLILSF